MTTLTATNPRTGIADYRCPATSRDELAAIAGRLRRGQASWAKLSVRDRGQALAEFGEQILERRNELLERLASDTGRLPLSRVEIDGIGHKIERDTRRAVEVFDSADGARSVSGPLSAHRLVEPYPLVGNITPWNFPVSLAFLDSLQALLAGSAVIVKPSEVTPRFIQPVQDAIEATPLVRDVFAFIAGDGATGAALVDEVDYICFTGSVATGQNVYAAAGARFIPASMELGGKDPAIVLDDVDVERAAASVLYGAILASGQICTSIERVYVDRTIHREFTDTIVALAERARTNIDDESGILVPFIHRPQADIFRRHVDDARSRGGRIVHGGQTQGDGGVWPSATVIDEANGDMLTMSEEAFSPIVPIQAFETDEQAIRLANDTRYGLSAVVYGRDLERASRVASAIRCGAASVNLSRAHIRMRAFEQETFGKSGIGKNRIGDDGFTRFCRRHALITGDFDEMAALEAEQVDAAFPER